MEGLLDHVLRDVLTRVGGIDRCVTEFIRVTDQLLPPRVFHRVMPELSQGSRTPAGVPVRAQLLGSDPGCLADNAARVVELGSLGVDLNFGCPAKTVNRHRGGAVLLDEPELLLQIVSAVRRAVPPVAVVSAKMRLGHRDTSRMLECAQAIAAGGAGELVVHGRTKLQGYQPPAHWAPIGRIREAVHIPVVANGEVWTAQDARRCREESGCQSLMVGRGLVANPGLARQLRNPAAPAVAWHELLELMQSFWLQVRAKVEPRHQAGRLKQWLNLLRRQFPQAAQAYAELRTVREPALVSAWLQQAQAGASSRVEAPQPANAPIALQAAAATGACAVRAHH